ncbi:hypothetical protein [Aliihoeflea sp. PC F10.4]
MLIRHFASLITLALGVGLIFLAIILPAAAQTIIDAGPAAFAIWDFVTPIVALVLLGIGLWLALKLASLIGLKMDAFHRAAVESVLNRAIGFAIVKVGDRARAGIPIAVKNQALAVAADYALRSIPGALKYFGKSRDDVIEMIEARIEDALVDDDSQVSAPVTATGQ